VIPLVLSVFNFSNYYSDLPFRPLVFGLNVLSYLDLLDVYYIPESVSGKI